jgi:hypothetical protein
MNAVPPAAERPRPVRHAKGKRPAFYETPGLDQAMSMILVLANEVAVLHDRLASVDLVFKARGTDLASEIEALVLDQSELEAREAWRQDFLARLYYLARKDAKEAADADTPDRFKAVIDDIART